jgi:murein tripeptide amidase MpaA
MGKIFRIISALFVFSFLILVLWTCQRSPTTMPLNMKVFTDFEGAAAAGIEIATSERIVFEIPPDPVGPEYLWFYFKIVADKPIQPELVLKNASGAHQTGKRWYITKPVISADGIHWIRSEQTSYPDVLGIRHLLGGQPQFHFRSPIAAETLWVAYCYPYTHVEWEQFYSTIGSRPGVSLKSIGKSEAGRDIPEVVIDLPTSGLPRDRKTIWVVCREHPGETPASFVCEGLIRALLDSSHARLLKTYRFRIVPMLNVDGIAQGHYYRNLQGINLATDWDHFKSSEVNALHSAMQTDLESGEVVLMVNLHSSNDPTKGHFFLEINHDRIKPELVEIQKRLLKAADGKQPQMQSRATVKLWDDRGITGNALNDRYGVYCWYLESNYSLGADGSIVTEESLREVGRALVNTLQQVLISE